MSLREISSSHTYQLLIVRIQKTGVKNQGDFDKIKNFTKIFTDFYYNSYLKVRLSVQFEIIHCSIV